METPTYITALLQQRNGKKAPSRRAWSIDVESVWVPFFTATNAAGESHLPSEALGAPLRLAKDKDGSVKFTKAGRPVLRLAPELNQQVAIVRENFVAGLQAFTGQVQEQQADAYQAQLDAAREAAAPIHEKAEADVNAALEMAKAAAEAEQAAPSKRGRPRHVGVAKAA